MEINKGERYGRRMTGKGNEGKTIIFEVNEGEKLMEGGTVREFKYGREWVK